MTGISLKKIVNSLSSPYYVYEKKDIQNISYL